jgi:hypothetical protein
MCSCQVLAASHFLLIQSIPAQASPESTFSQTEEPRVTSKGKETNSLKSENQSHPDVAIDSHRKCTETQKIKTGNLWCPKDGVGQCCCCA